MIIVNWTLMQMQDMTTNRRIILHHRKENQPMGRKRSQGRHHHPKENQDDRDPFQGPAFSRIFCKIPWHGANQFFKKQRISSERKFSYIHDEIRDARNIAQ
ncbi:hypothetical protein BI380_25610 [Delftia tsuruhatensis]|uniref:Uncharacterized protein n=1 Tax=Delftia tsuruhatensis TaxID=180282 RepID=A0ABM6EAS0_9BURK|nr:hypothetical protein BI380_25610 [Delftia tsuruhatensis]